MRRCAAARSTCLSLGSSVLLAKRLQLLYQVGLTTPVSICQYMLPFRIRIGHACQVPQQPVRLAYLQIAIVVIIPTVECKLGFDVTCLLPTLPRPHCFCMYCSLYCMSSSNIMLVSMRCESDIMMRHYTAHNLVSVNGVTFSVVWMLIMHQGLSPRVTVNRISVFVVSSFELKALPT